MRPFRATESFRTFAVDHPGNAEAVDEHAEANGPEGLLERHPHSAVFRQRAENALRLRRSEEHTSELQSLMRISYAVFCLKKKKQDTLKQSYVSELNQTQD